MIEKLKIGLLLALVGGVFGFGLLLVNKPRNNTDLFVDERGRVIDPYLQREVKNTIVFYAPEIRACYNELVARKAEDQTLTTQGTLHLDWMIGSQGRVSRPRVISSQLADSHFQNCILKAMASWVFPDPVSLRYAEHKFSFSESN